MTFADLFRSMLGLPSRQRPPDPDHGFHGTGEGFGHGQGFDPFFGAPGSGGRPHGPRQDGNFSSTFPGGSFFFRSFPPSGFLPLDEDDSDQAQPFEGIGLSPFGPSAKGSEDATALFQHFDDMFRNFDEVFRSIGMAEFPTSGPAGPMPFGAPPGGHQRNLSPRDAMLKEPDSHRHHDNTPAPQEPPPEGGGGGGGRGGLPSNDPEDSDRQSGRSRPPQTPFDWFFPPTPPPTMPQDPLDSDLDDEVRRGDLLQILRPSKPNPFPGVRIMEPRIKQAPQPSIKSVQVYTFRSADGKTEKRRITDDGFGNRETTVTRTMDDQSHSVTTKREADKGGDETVVQHYQNMDENDKRDFDERWQHPPHLGARHDNGPGRIYDLFKKGFSGFPSPKS